MEVQQSLERSTTLDMLRAPVEYDQEMTVDRIAAEYEVRLDETRVALTRLLQNLHVAVRESCDSPGSPLTKQNLTRIALLCNELYIIFRHSDMSVQECSRALPELCECFQPILTLLKTEQQSNDMRSLMIICAVIRITDRLMTGLASYCPQVTETLLAIIRIHLAIEIHLEAVRVLAGNLQHLSGFFMNEKCCMLLDPVLDLVTSILNTGSEHIIRVMLQLVTLVPELRGRILAHRNMTRAICKHLPQPETNRRSECLELMKELLRPFPYNMPCYPNCTAENLNLIVDFMAIAACEADDSSLTKLEISLFSLLAKRDEISTERMEMVRNTLIILSHDSRGCISDSSTEAAAVYFAISANCWGSISVMNCTVDLAISPNSEIRKQALHVLQDMTYFEPELGRDLLEHTAVLDCFSLILYGGCKTDCKDALLVCRQLASNQENHSTVCNHGRFLSALVNLTISSFTHRTAYIPAVETVLLLLSQDQTANAFKAYPKLLPWLVDFANRTTDDDLKAKIVANIVRLATTFLQD